MAQVLCHLPILADENLLVGLTSSDDAAVYRISQEQAVVLTMDFFTPVVDDPYTFGQIAAANAFSDIYAMGATPTAALNIACFPPNLPMEVMRGILQGGAERVLKAGAVLAGGHSIEDQEPKYGLSVLGLVHPEKILTNAGAKPGDLLILTKPLGVGILTTAIKGDHLTKQGKKEVIETMVYLNKDASLAALEVGVNGCTDITGFGLLGHLSELAESSQVSAEIWADQLPLLSATLELANMGFIPGGAYRNKAFYEKRIDFAPGLKQEITLIMFDPQTSGGLLISVAQGRAERLLQLLREKNKTASQIIGRVKPRGPRLIEVLDRAKPES